MIAVVVRQHPIHSQVLTRCPPKYHFFLKFVAIYKYVNICIFLLYVVVGKLEYSFLYFTSIPIAWITYLTVWNRCDRKNTIFLFVYQKIILNICSYVRVYNRFKKIWKKRQLRFWSIILYELFILSFKSIDDSGYFQRFWDSTLR